MEEKNGFHHPENRFSLSGISFFSKIGFSLAEKSPQIKKYCVK